MSTPSTADVEACARRINEGRSTNHHAFIVLQAYSALLEKLARVEALVAAGRAEGDDHTNEHEFLHWSEIEAALKGTE